MEEENTVSQKEIELYEKIKKVTYLVLSCAIIFSRWLHIHVHVNSVEVN